MERCGASPLSKVKKDWDLMEERTKRRHVSEATTVMNCVFNTIAGNDSEKLKTAVNQNIGRPSSIVAGNCNSTYLQALADSYHSASGWDTKRQIPSIMADLTTFDEIQQFIPGLTRYRFNVARKHILLEGRGTPVNQSKAEYM